MRQMFEPYYGTNVMAWPVGIDTRYWQPLAGQKDIDVLIYNKIRWDHDAFAASLLDPIRTVLGHRKLRVEEIRYGFYRPEELWQQVQRAKSVLFLCEHETQGLAYQQVLAANVPVFAWDRGGYWQDPSYYPHAVQFKEVSSVPYWDDRCGMKFRDLGEFTEKLGDFWDKTQSGAFAPREYIMENLTLEKCAQQYLDIVEEITA
jgi:glycosyltransferase involved in cell wall biosynthesis